MRFPPLVPFRLDEVDAKESPRRVVPSRWPMISALISALLGLLSTLAGCKVENPPDETQQPVETAPAPDDQMDDQSTLPDDINQPPQSPPSNPDQPYPPTDVPPTDEPDDSGTTPPGGAA